MGIELKRCPFCGGDAEIAHSENNRFLYVKCQRCNARGHTYFIDEVLTMNDEKEIDMLVMKAVNSWNRRV